MMLHKPFLQDYLVVTAGLRSPRLRSFNKVISNAPTSASSPWTNSKGSDTVLLLKFIEWQLALHLRDLQAFLKPHQEMLELLKLVSPSLWKCVKLVTPICPGHVHSSDTATL